MKGDPYILRPARFGTCAMCGRPLKGMDAVYWPRLRKAVCLECGEQDYRAAVALCREEDTGIPC